MLYTVQCCSCNLKLDFFFLLQYLLFSFLCFLCFLQWEWCSCFQRFFNSEEARFSLFFGGRKGWRESILYLHNPSANTLFGPDPGGLPSWPMCGSQAQLSHLRVDGLLCSSCNAFMQLPYIWGDAVGHEQCTCLDNSLPSGMQLYWFYS